MTATVTFSETGVLPGLRDALRSLFGMADGRDSAWQLGSDDVAEGLATVGELRQLLDVAEVMLVREGVTRGLPKDASWSDHDWVTRAEASRAPAPENRHVSRVLRVAKGVHGRGLSLANGLSGTSVDGVGGELGDEMGRETGSAAAVAASFEDGELSLGKADQLVRFGAGGSGGRPDDARR